MPTTTVRSSAQAAGRRLPDWTVLAPPAATLAVMLWGITARPYWGDEADTVSAASRALPQLIRLLGHIDAVHGLYYLLIWPFIRAFGPPELIGRLPSAAAMAASAFGIAVIGRRLVSRRAGLFAGLVFAFLPMVTVQGHDARPYAMSAAAAVLASVLLLRVADDPTLGRLVGYGLAITALGYLDLFGLLLVPAHAVTLAGLLRRAGLRRVARRWLAAIAAAAAVVVPLALVGWAQRQQIAWIHPPRWSDVNYLLRSLAFGSSASAVLFTLLAAHGAHRTGRAGPPEGAPPDEPSRGGPAAAEPLQPSAGRRHADLPRPQQSRPDEVPGEPLPDRLRGQTRDDQLRLGQRRPAQLQPTLPWLAAPWLVVPPLALMSVSEVFPVYNIRYVTFCLPAVALLVGAGLAALGQLTRVAALALIVALAAPPLQGLRIPGAGMRAAAQMIQAREKPGDAFIFPGVSVQPWYLVYPKAFGPLRDIALARSPAAVGHLYGASVPLPVLLRRERAVRRIWVVEMGPSWQSPAPYLAHGFWRVHFWRPGGGSVRFALYRR